MGITLPKVSFEEHPATTHQRLHSVRERVPVPVKIVPNEKKSPDESSRK